MSEGKPVVFVSYSHNDEAWKNRLVAQLGVLKHDCVAEAWDDRRIAGGDEWYKEIEAAIGRTRVAILLISADFLDSDFIRKEEVPKLLARREKAGMRLFPVILRPCAWQKVRWLSPTQARPKEGRPISDGDENRQEHDFADIVSEICDLVKGAVTSSATEGPALPPDNISISRLPSTGANLFGREPQLALLDEAWASPTTRVINLIAWGGIGKSALVNHWLAQMAKDRYRGAEQVFGWSFYSQGTSERVVSADQFIQSALGWFGDEDPTAGTPWAKGERLARLVSAKRTLLVLDGLEPLQNPPGPDQGRIKDPSLKALLRELAASGRGLTAITSRMSVADLDDFKNTSASHIDLMRLTSRAGAEVLSSKGIKGSQAELEEAVGAFNGHALALTLLANLLRDAHDGDIRYWKEVGPLEKEDEKGGHAIRVMESYAKWLGPGPELSVLKLLGLFDRPARKTETDALRAAPAINGLTGPGTAESIADDKVWKRALARLIHADLAIKDKEADSKETLDAHPLVREHFGEVLERTNPEAFKEGHRRLYKHLKATAKELPETLDEMAPLYAAVFHGCKAGLHQEALYEVYWDRISRRNKFFSTNQLGAFGADLAALSQFFSDPWTQSVSGLTEPAKAAVLGWAGFRLRALGRLREAAEPTRAGLAADIGREDWKNAAIAAGNLSQLHLLGGDIQEALVRTEESVALADRSGEWSQRMFTRTALADALHQAGRPDEEGRAFAEAEAMQRERQPEYPLLYSLQGYQYCDLLLGQGQAREVLERAKQTLKWAISAKASLLDIALNHLSLGRAHLMLGGKAEPAHLIEARSELNQAVEGLRQAGQQIHIPLGLLARAELFRTIGDYPAARADLTESLSIAAPSGMRRPEADIHLALARLFLTEGAQTSARQHLDIARDMVREMGYGRRSGEVAALEETLGSDPAWPGPLSPIPAG